MYKKKWDDNRKNYKQKLSVRMTDEDLIMIHEDVKRVGMNLQDYTHMVFFNQNKKIIIYKLETKEIERLLKNLTNNINQIAKLANSTGYINVEIIDKEMEKVDAIRHLLIQLTHEIKKKGIKP